VAQLVERRPDAEAAGKRSSRVLRSAVVWQRSAQVALSRFLADIRNKRGPATTITFCPRSGAAAMFIPTT